MSRMRVRSDDGEKAFIRETNAVRNTRKESIALSYRPLSTSSILNISSRNVISETPLSTMGFWSFWPIGVRFFVLTSTKFAKREEDS